MAVGIAFAAAAAVRHGSSSPRLTSTTTAGRHGATGGGARTVANAAALAVAAKLNIAQLAGQRVIYSYTGLTPPAGLLKLIRHGEVAGVIFFSGNVGSDAHLAAVVRQLQRANASSTNPVREPLLLMTDQEGGLVRRLPGEPVLSAKQIGESAHPWATATREGAAAAENLRGVGLNVNLAPVLDVFRTPGNFIDEFGRSFSSNPATVQKLGQLFATAMQQKYWAHGRSVPMLTSTRPIFFARSSWGSGGNPRKASILRSASNRIPSGASCTTHRTSFRGSRPT